MFFQPIVFSEEMYSVRTQRLTDFPMHWHSDLEIVHCRKGTFSVRLDTEEFRVEAGDILYVGSSVPHEYFQCSEDCVIALLRVGSVFIGNEVFVEIVKKQVAFPIIKENNKIQEIFDRLVALRYGEKKLENTLETQGLILFGISCILKCLPDRVHLLNLNQRLNSVLNIQSTLDYVALHFADNITLEEAAGISDYSKGAFCKMFKEATGMSFHQYLNDYRIKMACMLLRDDKSSITEIVEKVGFGDVKTFGRVFRQKMGMSPSEYRKIHQ